MAKKVLSKYELREFIESLNDTHDMCMTLKTQADYDRVIQKDEELIKLNRDIRFALETYYDALKKRFDAIREPTFGFIMECKE